MVPVDSYGHLPHDDPRRQHGALIDAATDPSPRISQGSDALGREETLAMAVAPKERGKRSRRGEKKDAEGSSAKTKRWAYTLLENVSDGFLVVDASEHLRYVNAAVERMLGCGRDELLGRTILTIFPETVGLPFCWHYYRVMAQRMPTRFEAYYPPLAMWIEVRLSPLEDGSVAAYLCDISGRKRAEQAIHDSERAAQAQAREMEATLDAIADAVLVYDAEGRVIRLNHAAITLLGLEPRRAHFATPIVERDTGLVVMHDLAGHPLPREQWPPIRVLRGEALTGGDTVDARVHTPDGRDLTLNISGAPIRDASGHVAGAVCICRDITERWHLERELAERASQIESIFETMNDGVALYDEQGLIIRANRAFLVSLGLDRSPQVALDFYASLPADRGQVLQMRDGNGQLLAPDGLPVTRALRGEVLEGATALEARVRTLDGRELDINASAAPIRDLTGRVSGAVAVFHDVTKRRGIEQQRSAIVRAVVHDILNPLTAVRLYVQAQQRRLREGKPPFVPDEALLTNMEYGFIRVQRLVADLRVATSIEAGSLRLERARCDLVEVCRHEVEVQQAVMGREVRLALPAEPVPLVVDGDRLGQVIANLLSNALKYSPAKRPVTLSLRSAARHVRVSVRDGGPGIPPAEQQRIWEQFHRVPGIKSQHGAGGLGLGLYLSKAIIERHGGQIGVKSTVGRGSTFWFTLPTIPAVT